MLLRIFSPFFFMLVFFSIHAQDNKQYLITSDSELVSLGNPRVIDGDLEIKGISSFDNLSNLEEVNGDLIIGNLDPEAYGGFSSLRKLAGDLIVRNTEHVGVLDLQSLTEVRSIEIVNNTKLEAINLQGLRKVSNHIILKDNSQLSAMVFETVSNKRMQFVEIVNNPVLSIVYAPNIQEVDYIEISNNPEMSMTEWPSLEKVNQHINIKYSVRFGITQFDKLESVGTFIHLDQIPEAVIVEFKKLKSIGKQKGNDENGFLISNMDIIGIRLLELSRVEGEFKLLNNKLFQSVYCQIPRLQHLNSLKLINNDSLGNANFLPSLTSISDSIIIRDNKKLASCALPFICSLSDEVFNSKLIVENNLDCCTDLDHLREECEEKCCPFSTTYIFDRCDVFIFRNDEGECYQVTIDSDGTPETSKVDCPE
jgi:hypothetical protein